jgi:hypothetical protein
MATVRFSKELTDVIIKNAGHMFDKQMDAARNNINATWGDRIYEIIHRKYIPAMGALPMHFFSTTWEMKVSKINGKDIGGLVCKLTAERPVPNSLPKDVPAKGKDYYGYELVGHEWEDIAQEIADYQACIVAVAGKKKAFIDSVKKVIEAHATLAPALKMWSPLWDLIPEDYKERHRQVVEREKKEVKVDVDLSALTAQVAFHKMTK